MAQVLLSYKQMSEKVDILSYDFKQRVNRYLTYLKFTKARGKSLFALDDMAITLNFDQEEVANDLRLVGIYPTYAPIQVGTTITKLESCTENRRLTEAFLICTRSHGAAFMAISKLYEQGIKIVAAFDPSPSYEPYEIDGIKVLGIDKIYTLSDRMHIDLVVIATNSQIASYCATIAVKAEAKALLNCTKDEILVPDGIIYVKAPNADRIGVSIDQIKERLNSK